MDSNAPSKPGKGRPRIELIDVLAPSTGADVPRSRDRVDRWLDGAVANALQAASINTVGDMIDTYRRRGPTWFNAVALIGQVKGHHLNRWLQDAGLVAVPTSAQGLQERPALAPPVDAAHTQVCDLVVYPSTDLFAPALQAQPMEADNRRAGPNAFGATDDIGAISIWLKAFEKAGKKRTVEAYSRELDRYLIWLRYVGVTFSEATLDHAQRYQAFLSSIPVQFIGHERVKRLDTRWRPFRGSLTTRSQNYAIQVVAQCYEAIQKSGYLHFNPFAGIKRPAVGGRQMDTTRSLSREDLEWASKALEAREALCSGAIEGLPIGEAHRLAIARRTRLAMKVLLHTGLRLEEVTTTTMESARPARMDGRDLPGMWSIAVRGKGGRERDIYLPEHVIQMARDHHADVRYLLNSVGGDVAADRLKSLEARPPLLCAITAPVGKDVHSRAIDDEAVMANDNLALSKAGLYKTLKTFFRTGTQEPIRRLRLEIIKFERESGAGGQALAKLKQELSVWVKRSKMSTHWMRHTFALEVLRSSGSDRGLKVAQQLLGHQSITTTAEYLRQDESEKVSVTSKLSFF